MVSWAGILVVVFLFMIEGQLVGEVYLVPR